MRLKVKKIFLKVLRILHQVKYFAVEYNKQGWQEVQVTSMGSDSQDGEVIIKHVVS
jgi:hypothetical protein